MFVSCNFYPPINLNAIKAEKRGCFENTLKTREKSASFLPFFLISMKLPLPVVAMANCLFFFQGETQHSRAACWVLLPALALALALALAHFFGCSACSLLGHQCAPQHRPLRSCASQHSRVGAACCVLLLALALARFFGWSST